MAMAYGSGDMTGRPAQKRAGRKGKLSAAAKAKLKAFRVARRHTWLVRSLKVLLPSAIVLVFVAYGFLLRGSVDAGPGKLSVGKIEVTADDLKMKNLTYFGVTKDGGKYDVRAKEAAVDFAQTGPVRLDFIEGDLTQATGVVTRLKSRRGMLDNKKGEMELLDGVEISSSNGLAARLHSAKVFNKDHRIVSQQPIVAAMPAGQIQANAMDLEAKARRGVFNGDVRVRLTQSEGAGKTNISLTRGEAKGPVDVRSQRLDMDDTAKLANFSGGVTAQQGETTLQASALKVIYEGRAAVPDGSAAVVAAAGGDAAQVTKLSAQGNVVIVAGADRKITSDAVELDVKNDSALFTGGRVEVQQGTNRLAGRRLAVDRKNGKSRLDAPADGRTPAGRIQTVFVPAADKAKPQPKASEAGGGSIATFKTDPNAPMDIEADSLDVSDAARQAVFRGRVQAKQGDFAVQAAELVAHFSGETGLMSTADAPAAKGGAQITKVEAKNKVVITSKDGQEATGDWATFDTKANTVLLGGGVTVRRGRDVVTGPRLRIDTVSGVAQFENEPGKGTLGPALPAQTAPRSAPGPGGLPAVSATTPAPTAPSPCVGDRKCLTFYPEDAKKAAKEQVQKARPKTDATSPSSSPSQVYRAP